MRLPIPPPGRLDEVNLERSTGQCQRFFHFSEALLPRYCRRVRLLPLPVVMHEKTGFRRLCRDQVMVPRRGLEPPRFYPLVPETSASTNSATWAPQELRIMGKRQAFVKPWRRKFSMRPGSCLAYRADMKKPAFAGLIVWCPEEDSNLHGFTR